MCLHSSHWPDVLRACGVFVCMQACDVVCINAWIMGVCMCVSACMYVRACVGMCCVCGYVLCPCMCAGKTDDVCECVTLLCVIVLF